LGHQSFDANGDTTNRVITLYKVGPNPPGKPVSTPGWNPVAAVKLPWWSPDAVASWCRYVLN